MKNINDYKNAISRMHAKSEIDLSKIESGTGKRHVSGKKFFPAFAVAAAFALGTVGAAAANLDWIRSFFHKEIFISEDVEALVADFDNYECFSNCGINMSLDGVVADEQSIYCQFTINESPEEYDLSELGLNRIESESFRFTEDCRNVGSTGSGSVNDEGKFILSCSWDKAYLSQHDSIAIHIDNHEYPELGKTVYDSDDDSTLYYPYELMAPENFENCNADYVLIRFDLRFNKTPAAEISNEELETDDDFFGDIKITPFKMICENSSSSPLWQKAKIILKDGREVISGEEDIAFSGSSCADPENPDRIVNEGTQMWEFGEPINPESVNEIYVGDQLIYKK
ncbi:MAG: hypothetical protein ACI4JB_02950 [Porcipelethomonas sp.]